MAHASIYKSPGAKAEVLAYYDRTLAAIGLPFEDITVHTRFGDTHLLATGPAEAPPLVILHGGNVVNPLSLWWFRPLMERYRVYAPDTIGHPGKSSETRLSPNDNSYGQWVTDILDGLKLDKATLIGPSYGGGMVLRTAAFAPERIDRAVLIVPASLGLSWSGLARITWPTLLYMIGRNQRHLIQSVSTMFTEPPDSDMVDFVGLVYRAVRLEAQMPRNVTREELARFTAPTLLIAAEADVLFPAAKILPRARQVIPNLQQVHVLQKSGHYPSNAGIAQMNRWIMEFLGLHKL